MEFETLTNAIENCDEGIIWKSYICVYCIENGIGVGTNTWNKIITYLYKIARATYIDFDCSLEEFDKSMSEFLI